ncbi:MAG: lysophospholipid acyltransferase family protein [Sorangiineae bacterium]|nr:lysophospholipid acyltransferase family protein [Polyangiaceae bacterium]MEB2325151.1 lysophospholipid acyltransferase family protein [Sorangiineae bacterium]
MGLPSNPIPVSRVILRTLGGSAAVLAAAATGRLDRAAATRHIDDWSRALVELAELELVVRGREHLPPASEPLVVMSNHQSHFDIVCLFQALERPLRMIAKSELFRLPVFGRALRAAEFVELDRGNHARALASLQAATQKLRSGLSVWIAPEGTRSETGRVGAFKKGGFHLALETGVRILPVAIEGTRRVLPARSFSLTRGLPVEIGFAPPVDPAEFGAARRDELIYAVRSAIVARLPEELRG